MTKKIFISYRRVDTEGYAGRIYDRLSQYFHESEIFMDVDDIEPGDDFVNALESAVSSCDVLIALIGRQWLDVTDERGDKRLDNPNDFVRLEIATALNRKIKVVPVLLGGAVMPRQKDLPDDLKSLSSRNALEVHHSSFNSDIQKLRRSIEKSLESQLVSFIKKTITGTPSSQILRSSSSNLVLELTSAPNPTGLDSSVTWTVIVRNESNDLAKDMILIHKRTILEDNIELVPGEEKKFSFSKTYSEFGEFSEKVRIMGSGIQEETMGFVTVLKPASLDLQLSTSVDIAEVGEQMVWTVSVVNNGGVDLNQILICRGDELLEDPFSLLKNEQRLITYAQTYGEPGKYAEKVTSTAITDISGKLEQETESRIIVERTKWIITTSLEKIELIIVPAGEFFMGEGNEQHKHFLPEYLISKTQVTNEQYEVFVKATGRRPPSHWIKGIIPEGKRDHPVTKVNWFDAMDFCKWLSEQSSRDYRLPSEAEWEKAARGKDARIYPWGNDWETSKCNTLESGISDTTSVGQFSPWGDSPYGCMDMAGNVWEWTLSKQKRYPYDPLDGRENTESDEDTRRIIRGGAWSIDKNKARCAFRDWYIPDIGSDGGGFRLVVTSQND